MNTFTISSRWLNAYGFESNYNWFPNTVINNTDNTESNFLEPSFGNGNFVIYIIYNKIQHGSTWKQALEHTYGTELMQDNVIETHGRILEMLSKLNIDYNVDTAKSILNNNLVCADFFKWDFENWCPIKENKCEALF